MNIHSPLVVDDAGKLAAVEARAHIRQLIENLLFTDPGERVNRPTFGCGLLRAVFGSMRPEELMALQFVVQQALIEWLSEEIEPRGVELRHVESTLFVHITYLSKLDRRAETVSFEVAVP